MINNKMGGSMVSDSTDYNESANIAKVNAGLNGAGGPFYRNAAHRPPLTFKDVAPRTAKTFEDRNDIKSIPIVDSYCRD